MREISDSYKRQIAEEKIMEIPSSISNPQSIDSWRHYRILDELSQIINFMPDAKWMTVGDGRYASDAAYLDKKGVDVLATSLTDEKLAISKKMGYIKNYRAENAEKISLDDNSIDFVLCKEAYHHLPRPPIGLYEMLRVSKEALIIIEPIEGTRLLNKIKHLIKLLIRREKDIQFEVSGNFLYRVDLKELDKLLHAMGKKRYSYKGINDFYYPGFGKFEINSINLKSFITKLAINVQNILSKLRLYTPGLASIVIFKDEPSPKLIKALSSAGYNNIKLKKNPYT